MAVLCAAWTSWADLTAEQQAGLDPDQHADAAMTASELLYAWTQQRWRGAGCSGRAVISSDRASGWWDQSWGACGCWTYWAGLPGFPHVAAPVTVQLPHLAAAVTAVTVGGAVFTAWRLDGRWLTRTDGRGWPVCGDTVTVVDYLHGQPPPAAGRAAAGVLALELARSRAGLPCRLPSRVTAVTRQGTTMQRAVSPVSGPVVTGLPEVDMWVASVNPARVAQRSRYVSPDGPHIARDVL
ncbi:MAG: hypothetical protein ACRCZP_17670 [Phycicoccus sp.]